MTRRFLLTIISLLIALPSLTAAPNAIAADAGVFMNELWHHAVEVLSKKAPVAERLARFRQLFQADFDGPGIARFVLGRYWRSANEQEQQEFLRLFEDYVIFVYGTRLSNFNGETFKVRSSRTDESGTVVSTDIVGPSGEAPIKVDWRLITRQGRVQDQRRHHRGHQHAGDLTLGIRLGNPASRRSSWRAFGIDAGENSHRQCRAITLQAVS